MRISDWSSDVCSSDLRTLQALGDTELQAQVGTAVDDALTALQNKAPQRLQPVMRELEAQRLRELILAWLVVERERATFQVLKLEARGPGEAQNGEAVREFEGLRSADRCVGKELFSSGSSSLRAMALQKKIRLNTNP